MTRVDIISGFLGAGKTTFIKKLLKECFQGEKLVLIENEFGEIGIDGDFLQESGILKESGVRVNELNSGCICCSLAGDFDQALQDVVEQYQPERIIIEPSGVAKLSDINRAVRNAGKTIPVELGCAIAVVDAKRCRAFMRSFGEFYLDQIVTAGTIVLSRTQELSEETLAEVVALLREHNADATVITTPWDELSGDVIRSAMSRHSLAEELIAETKAARHEHHHHHDHEHHHYDGVCHDPNCSCRHHDHGHDADEVFVSWGAETSRRFTEAEIRAALEKLDCGAYGIVLRSKGIVPAVGGGWLHFDMVPGEVDIRTGSADYTGRLCVIGSELKESKLPGVFGL